MLWICRFLALLPLALAAPTASAQSALTIDKIGKESVSDGGANSAAFTALLEGVVADPALSVYVIVKTPGPARERIFPAAVDSTHPDSADGYRWRAVCQFGGLDGRGTGDSYEARVAAIDPAGVKRGKLLETLLASKIQTNAVRIKRDRK